MPHYLPHHKIDKVKWDACVTNATNAMVYGESWYLDTVSPGWDGLVLGDYEAVMPLPHRRKWGVKYIYQPPFTQQLGVFGRADADIFLAAIPKDFRLVDLQLNFFNKLNESKGIVRPNLVLPLNSSVNELRKNYSENTRRNIRKAVDAGLSNEPPATVEEIIDLFRQYRGSSIDTLRENEYQLLQQLCKAAASRGILELPSNRTAEGNLLAGAIFLRSAHGWIFLFSATHPDGRQSGAMPALIDRFIEKHAGEDTVLDFEGSSDANLYRFYKSFGSMEIVYLQLRINRLLFPFNLFKS